MLSPSEEMLASANGLYSFGGVLGQGVKSLVSAQQMEETQTLQRQATAALQRSLHAAEQAQRVGNLAVNISNHAVQRVRQMAMLREQGVNDPFSTHNNIFGQIAGNVQPGQGPNSRFAGTPADNEMEEKDISTVDQKEEGEAKEATEQLQDNVNSNTNVSSTKSAEQNNDLTEEIPGNNDNVEKKSA